MNAEIKQKWVAALRSGEFQQARGELKNDGGHCCLGVLCELAVRHGIATEVEGEFGPHDGPLDDYAEWSETVLPPVVFKWAGLQEDDPEITSQGRSLAGLNDNGKTFPEIAAFIEAEL